MVKNTIASLFATIFLLAAGLTLQGQPVRFTLLNTTDEHSTLKPLPMADYRPGEKGPSEGGYARLATVVKGIREEDPGQTVLLFSSGDIIGGTPFAWLALEGYSPEIELMKRIGYNGMTIGNHEFDYGPELLAKYLMRAGYPGYNDTLALISSNLVIPDGHPLENAGIMNNRLYDLPGGVTVGLFGLLGREAYSVASFAEPVTVTDQHTAARQQVQSLREAGADIIIALTHSGIGEDRELAGAVEGIDIILGGHDHYITPVPERVNRTYIHHTGYYLKYLGRLDIEFEKESGLLSVVNSANESPYLIHLDSTVDEDPEILRLTSGYLGALNEFVSAHTDGEFTDVTRTVVYSDFSLVSPGPFQETTPGNFVTDAMRIMGEQITGRRVDVAFQGNGIIRADIVPGSMEWSAGEVPLFDLATVSGLGSGPDERAGYPLVSLYLTERELLNVLEISSLLSQLMGDIYFLQVSGLRYSYDPGKATWMTIPFAGLPVPAYRSVRKAEIYTGSGIQDTGQWEEIDGSGDRLYHVVTDYYLTSFLPMVGDILPRLGLVLKDVNGDPVELESTIIYRNDKEYKVWEAVAQYAASQVEAVAGRAEIPLYYSETDGRITAVRGIPLWVWSWLATGLILLLILFLARSLFRRFRRS